jgi:hypothetical protein
MLYIYFFSGFIFGGSMISFFLIKELYVQNKKNVVQANQIERLEKLNQMLATQISEESVYGQKKNPVNVK